MVHFLPESGSWGQLSVGRPWPSVVYCARKKIVGYIAMVILRHDGLWCVNVSAWVWLPKWVSVSVTEYACMWVCVRVNPWVSATEWVCRWEWMFMYLSVCKCARVGVKTWVWVNALVWVDTWFSTRIWVNA